MSNVYAPPPFLLIPASPANTRYPTSAAGKVVLPAITSTLRPPPPPPSSSSSSTPDRDEQYHMSSPHLKASNRATSSSSASSPPHPHHRELAFKAPTHPHSHHLHTIPPREKTTHSLIVGQLLDQHSSVLLAATRAELAWGNVTGVEQELESRHSHEFFTGFVMEQEDEQDEDVSMRVPNTTLAQTLHAKAQGLSNVICATLSGDSTTPVPHLPSIVRFRLALSILADQLLAPPLTQQSSSTEQQQLPEIPLDLAPFVSLSSFRLSGIPQPQHTTSLPGIQSFFNPPQQSPTTSTMPKSSVFSSFAAPGLSSGPSKALFPTSAASSSLNGRQKSNSVSLGGFSSPEVSVNIHIPPIYSTPRPIVRSNKVIDKMSTPMPMPKAMTVPIWTTPTSPTSPKDPNSATSSSSSSSTLVFNTPIPSSISQSLCVRHMRLNTQCSSPACHPIPRSVRSSIGAGLGSRALSALSLAGATLSSSQPHFLTVLSNFLRISAFVVSEEMEDGTEVTATRGWYALLCELLTRCVIEGYGRCGWRGTKAAEVLFGFGGGKGVVVDKDSEQGVYDPDGFPSLNKAYTVLFPPSSSSAEFANELKRRKNNFLSAPSSSSSSSPSTTSLTTHIQTLSSETFPIEPLEKLMIRFVDTAARWNVEDGYEGMDKYFTLKATALKRGRSASMSPPRETVVVVDAVGGRRYSSPPVRKKVAV